MPICYNTVEYPGELAKILLDSPLLRFDESRERGQPTVKRYWTNEKFRNFSFTINPKMDKVILKGSWHKFHNEGLHNYTRYTSADLLADITTLSNLFDYDFSQGLLRGVEAGVNLNLSNLPQPYFTPEYILPLIICYQGRKPFLPMRSIRGTGHGVECSMSNYRIKIYDKGTQYHLPTPLLRVEYDCNMMKELQPFGIRKLSDLTDHHKMSLLGHKFHEMLSDIIVVEPLMIDTCSKAQRKLYEKAERPLFWSKLNRRDRSHYLGRFREMSQTYSAYRMHQTLCVEARQEWSRLTENCNVFAVETSIADSVEEDRNCNIFLPVNSGKCYNSLPEMVRGNFSEQIASFSSSQGQQPHPAKQTERRCQITGILLCEQQPASSKVIGLTTLRNNPEVTVQLRQRYGSKKRKRESHTEAYYLVHGLRNEKSNPPNNLLRRIRKAQANTPLFPVVKVLRLSASQQAMLAYFDGTRNEVDGSIKQLLRNEELIDSFPGIKSVQAGGMV